MPKVAIINSPRTYPKEFIMFDSVLLPSSGVLPVAGLDALSFADAASALLSMQSPEISSWVDDHPPPPPPSK